MTTYYELLLSEQEMDLVEAALDNYAAYLNTFGEDEPNAEKNAQAAQKLRDRFSTTLPARTR